MIRAVFFDIGGTVHTQRKSDKADLRYLEMLWEFLTLHNIPTAKTPEELMESVDVGAKRYKHYQEESLRELPPDQIWSEYMLSDYPAAAKKLKGHGEELCWMFDRYRKDITVRPGLAETLQELRKRGYRLGIISNIMSITFVPKILSEYGVRDLFESIILSSACGVRKPDKKIFDLALQTMGIDRDEAAYVGDTVSRDVIGTRNAGWKLMIQIDNPLVYHKDEKYQDFNMKPDIKISELPELLTHLMGVKQ